MQHRQDPGTSRGRGRRRDAYIYTEILLAISKYILYYIIIPIKNVFVATPIRSGHLSRPRTAARYIYIHGNIIGYINNVYYIIL